MNPRFSTNGHSAPKPTIEDRKKALVRDLKSEYEQINQELSDAIEWLREIPVLYGAELVICSDDSGRYETRLGYFKYGGVWSIYLGDEDTLWRGNETQIEWKPVLECSMEDKSAALRHLADLKAKVVEEGENFVHSRRQTTAELDI